MAEGPPREWFYPRFFRRPHRGASPGNLTRGLLTLLVVLPALLYLAACDSDSDTQPFQHTPSVLEQPATIDLAPSLDDNRIYIGVIAVGEQPVSMISIFDTGSAGVTLSAQAIFPQEMFNADGLVFPEGQSSLTYHGITVFNQKGTKAYGGAGGFTETGYLGFAQLTFGGAAGQLTTTTMPLFLYYSTTANDPPHQAVDVGPFQGIFGVDPLADEITAPSTSPPFPECTPQAQLPCYTASVFKYLGYSNGVHAGFLLRPAPLQSCNIETGSCIPVPTLTVGLTSAMEDGFSDYSLECPPMSDELPIYHGPDSIQGYPVCEKSIPQATVTLSSPSGQITGSITGRVLFDTGSPAPYLVPLAGQTFPVSVSVDTDVMVMLPSGFIYSYIAGSSAITDTTVNPMGNNKQNHIGVSYFTTNSFFIDYLNSKEGWF
jgi:hypothetical protein